MADPRDPRTPATYSPWPVSPSEWVQITPEPQQAAATPPITGPATDFLVRADTGDEATEPDDGTAPEAPDAAPPESAPEDSGAPEVDDDPPFFAQLQAQWLPRGLSSDDTDRS